MVSTASTAPVKVFVSYRHMDGDWVWNRLVPCLRAGGAEVLIDEERFRPGGGVYRQMDETQDKADKHILVLSNNYLASDACKHEMARAIAKDPSFTNHIVLPVMRDDCPIPDPLKAGHMLYTDLRDDRQPAPWGKLLAECGADLGTAAPHWLECRDEVAGYLANRLSVNLLVRTEGPNWRELIKAVAQTPGGHLGEVDLDAGVTASRPGLIREILNKCHIGHPVRDPPHDLADLQSALAPHALTRVALWHFHRAARPARLEQYGEDLFSALRWQIMEAKNLVLLLHSRDPFAALLPKGHQLSHIEIRTVELKAHP